MEERKICCRVLTGPTASGKSALALRLAKEKGLAILSMDSMQIYMGLDIGTAKPSQEKRRQVPHYLLDLLDPADSFSVSEYRERAETLVRELWDKERQEVLFVGGTGLYLQAMMHPWSMGAVPANEEKRNLLRQIASEPGGKEKLHARLQVLDPVTAERLPINDVRRIIRAIEVSEATGLPFSQQPNRHTESAFSWKIVSTAMPREMLYERINRRVIQMIQKGLREEVAGLLASGVPEGAQSMSGLGYKEMIPCVKGEKSLEETTTAIQLGTRHYAKRQMTFLRRETDINYVDCTCEDCFGRIAEALDL